MFPTAWLVIFIMKRVENSFSVSNAHLPTSVKNTGRQKNS